MKKGHIGHRTGNQTFENMYKRKRTISQGQEYDCH